MDERARPLLNFIGKTEIGNAAKDQGVPSDYDVVYGGIASGDRPQNRVGKHLRQMTVQEVWNWQEIIDRYYPSEASGRYQIMQDTLFDMMSAGQIKGNMLFNEAGQDECGFVLLKRRGWQEFIDGSSTVEAFADNLAREWASFPVHSDQLGPKDRNGKRRQLKRGQSYYAGDGLNNAHASCGDVVRVLAGIRENATHAPSEPPKADLQAQIDELRAQIAAIHAATAPRV